MGKKGNADLQQNQRKQNKKGGKQKYQETYSKAVQNLSHPGLLVYQTNIFRHY